MSIVEGKGTTALSEWMRGFKSSGQIWDGKPLHIAVADELDLMAAEIERLRARIDEIKSSPAAEISATEQKLAGWIMTADDDCGADWFEFAGDHKKPPEADKFFRPVPVFFGAAEGVCLGDPVAALEQIGQLIGAEGQAALAQSEHLKNLAP